VHKAFLGPLAPSCPNYGRHQDVLLVKQVASSCHVCNLWSVVNPSWFI